MSGRTPTRVLILGGGFGGIYAAMRLDRTLARRDDVEVTLVARDNFFLFTPMLHEVAASDLDLTNIVSPIRKLLRRVKFFQGEVDSIDLHTRSVTVRHGSDGHRHTLGCDHLVLAMGAVTNYYGLTGAAEHTLTMKTLADAVTLRNRIIARLEEADTECARAVRRPLLTFVVVGAAFAGVETIGSINDFVRRSLRFYPSLSPSDVRMVLVHAGEWILPELGSALGSYAQRKLAQQGVAILTGAKVVGVGGECVELGDGTLIPTRSVVWTAGNSPHPMVSQLPCALARGRVEVDACLRVSGFENVWALGDCAAVPDVLAGLTCPPTAQHALRQGTRLADNIRASIDGTMPRPFRFRSPGALATIGRRTGVARILGINFSGFVAWFLWRAIYLSKLPRLEKKLRVALDWTLDLFFTKDLVQYLSEPLPDVRDSHESVTERSDRASDEAYAMSHSL